MSSILSAAAARHCRLLCMVMHQCERVGIDFIDSAPFRFVSTVDLTITPEQVFEALDDAESWPLWATVITKVTWSSPQPHGVGTTRTVDMRGGIVGDEEFSAWEPHSHMAFRFNQASIRSIAAFAEDYRVVPTATAFPAEMAFQQPQIERGAAGVPLRRRPLQKG